MLGSISSDVGKSLSFICILYPSKPKSHLFTLTSTEFLTKRFAFAIAIANVYSLWMNGWIEFWIGLSEMCKASNNSMILYLYDSFTGDKIAETEKRFRWINVKLKKVVNDTTDKLKLC